MTSYFAHRPAHENACADVHARLGDPRRVLLDARSRADHAAAPAGIAR